MITILSSSIQSIYFADAFERIIVFVSFFFGESKHEIKQVIKNGPRSK